MIPNTDIPWFIDMYLHSCVPLWMFGCILVFIVIGLIWKWQYRYLILLSAWMMFILCHTIVFRKSSSEIHAILVPFWNYRDVFLNGNLEDMGEIIMNVVLYIPIGILGALQNKLRSYHVFLIGFCYSLFIELLQLILHRGLCETDDLIHNTLGVIIGYTVMRSIMLFVNWTHKKLSNI